MRSWTAGWLCLLVLSAMAQTPASGPRNFAQAVSDVDGY
jgi:hypothetical protein